MVLDVAAPARLAGAGVWLNLHLAVAPSETGLRLVSARIGRLPIPPWLALQAIRLGLDAKLGDGLGTDLLAGVAAVRLAPPQVTWRSTSRRSSAPPSSSGCGRGRWRRRAPRRASGSISIFGICRRGVNQGRLPRDGSVVPYLLDAVDFAAQPSDAPDREEMRAALYALALYCGDADFGRTISVDLPGDAGAPPTAARARGSAGGTT